MSHARLSSPTVPGAVVPAHVAQECHSWGWWPCCYPWPGLALAQTERPNKPRPASARLWCICWEHTAVAFPGALGQLQGVNGCAGAAPAHQPPTSVPWPLLGNMGASFAGGNYLSTQGKGLLVNECLGVCVKDGYGWDKSLGLYTQVLLAHV